MWNSIKSILKYWKLSFIFDLKANFAYPTTFWMTFLTVPMWAVTQILFIETIYGQTGNFLGYTKYENYVLFGTCKLVQSIAVFLFYVRLEDLAEKIRGQSDWSLDMMLLKPIDSQLFVTTGKYWLGSLSSMAVGAALIVYGYAHEPHLITLLSVLGYVGIMALAVVFLYVIFLFIQTLLFYTDYLQVGESLWITFHEYGQYPRQLYQGGVGIIFNIIIPITLMGSVPVEILYGKMPLPMILVYTLVVGILFLLSRLFWLHSLKRYASSSS